MKSRGARDHIRSVESGQLRYADLRDRALATGSDADLRTASEVPSTLDGFEWVATVRIEGHDRGRSHHKAMVVGGLAIDAIGLRFRVEDARRRVTDGDRVRSRGERDRDGGDRQRSQNPASAVAALRLEVIGVLG